MCPMCTEAGPGLTGPARLGEEGLQVFGAVQRTGDGRDREDIKVVRDVLGRAAAPVPDQGQESKLRQPCPVLFHGPLKGAVHAAARR